MGSGERLPEDLDLGEIYRWIVMSGPSPVVASDAQGRILVFNPAAERLLGCPAEVARRIHQFADFHADAREFNRILDGLREAEGEALSRSFRLRSLAGEAIPVRGHFHAFRSPTGEIIAVLGIFEDQRETESLFERLEQATRQLIEGERRFEALEKGRALAHEMNQPLTVAMGSLEILASNMELPTGVRVRLDRAYEQLQRMARMVRRLSSTGRRVQDDSTFASEEPRE